MQQPNIEAYVLPRLEMRFETFKKQRTSTMSMQSTRVLLSGKAPSLRPESTFIARAMESMNQRCQKQIDSGTRRQPGLTAGLK